MEGFSKYEVARILGARALQIAMNAPLLIKINQEDLEKVKFDALKIAEIEFESGVLPISVKRPFPKRKDERLKRVKEQKVSEEKIERRNAEEEEEIAKEGEIMGLVNPEEEDDGNSDGDGSDDE
ncbi:MAG: DNA-directed RNA polymerase subunit K [Nanoarchaeota archaeon]|nr:DNA-directed RNA polymerase subunit K [Nanoarchaeota archaeon]MBU1501658.1 DNA-directed RNA polymerase subunit K [Nanoarchaeota archaeon]MBU2458943.1 DNA-directed RNA polymerase subunit K [Nanoarchaeota archaeon]